MTDAERRAAMGKLLQELFLMLRSLMPTSKENTQRQTEFAARLQAFIEGRDTDEGN